MTRTDDTARERQLERYLLDTLSDDDKSRLDEAILADHALFAELDAAEGVLIDRYLEGDLAGEDRQLFEERLLPSARVRERVAMASALQQLADARAKHAGDRGAGELVSLLPFRARRVVPSGRVTNWLAWAACLLLMLVTGYLAILNFRLTERFDQVEAHHQAAIERAQAAEKAAQTYAQALSETTAQADHETVANSHFRDELTLREKQIDELKAEISRMRETSAAQATRTLEPVVVLLAQTLRSEGQTPVLERPTEAALELQLDLDRFEPEGPLQAVIKRDNVPIWRQSQLELVSLGPYVMAPLILPNEVLLEGSYTVELTEMTGETALPYEYRFIIKN